MNIHWINQRRPQAANQSMTAKTETIRPAQFFSTFHKWRSALAVGSMLCGLGLAGAQAASIASWDFTGASTPATQAASPFNANLIGAPVLSRGAGAAVQEVGALAADISLTSPISAEVDKVVLHQGELTPPGFPIMTLVNLDDVWVVFNLRENELAQIKIGTQITGRVPALGGRTITFSVYYISPRGEYATWRATRQSSGYDIKTFEVRARPADKVTGLRPGMSVLVDRS